MALGWMGADLHSSHRYPGIQARSQEFGSTVRIEQMEILTTDFITLREL